MLFAFSIPCTPLISECVPMAVQQDIALDLFSVRGFAEFTNKHGRRRRDGSTTDLAFCYFVQLFDGK